MYMLWAYTVEERKRKAIFYYTIYDCKLIMNNRKFPEKPETF